MGSSQFEPVTHVIFDMDGLLLDTETKYEAAIENLCQKYGSTYTLEAKIDTIGRTARDGAAAVIRHCNLPIDIDQYLKEIEEEYVRVFHGVTFLPGAEKLINHLSENNIPIAIATSSKRTNFERKTRDLTEKFKVFHHIVLGSDDDEVKNGKPAPDIYQVASRRFSVEPDSPKKVLVFEDATAGVIAGLAAGMQVVWVPHPCLDHSKQETTLLIKSLEDFQPELFGLPKY